MQAVTWEATVQPGMGQRDVRSYGSMGMMLTPAAVWVPPRCQPHDVSGVLDLGWTGCSGASLCTAPTLDSGGGWCMGSMGPFTPCGQCAGLVLTPGDVEGSDPPGGEDKGR